jgi:hypothetical protein
LERALRYFDERERRKSYRHRPRGFLLRYGILPEIEPAFDSLNPLSQTIVSRMLFGMSP